MMFYIYQHIQRYDGTEEVRFLGKSPDILLAEQFKRKLIDGYRRKPESTIIRTAFYISETEDPDAIKGF